MKTVAITDKPSIAELLPENGEDVLLVRDGHAVALVTPVDDDDLDWYARERDPAFVESIRRAREQIKRGETMSQAELDRVLSKDTDGIDLSDFSPPVSVETLQRTKCSAVPTRPGVYVVLYPAGRAPVFLKKSVGGWFKDQDPSDPLDFVRAHWVDQASIVYIGKGNGQSGLRQRLCQFIQFGMGKSVGHRGGRLVWHLANHKQLLVRWRVTPNERPEDDESRLVEQFRSAHGVRPFANLRD